MAATSIEPTFPIFTDIDGQPLEDGFVWIGTINLDPQTNPIAVFSDAALNIPLAQPVRTIGGYPASAGTPVRVYANSDYSIRVMNKNGSVVYSAPSPTARYPANILPDGSVTTAKLADDAVTFAKTQNIATQRILGRTTAGSGDIEELTAAQAIAILGQRPEIQPISATVAANALTVSASALTLDFRSTTLGSGTVTTVTGTPASLTVPSGATLGTVSAVQSDIMLLALNNAGTLELAVVNSAGGTDLSETGLITTTAISAGSTSASTVYSTTARTNVAYRVIGVVRSTQTTAGTWATAPSLIQGQGGQAFAAMQSLGYGQTWQLFTIGTARVYGTTYYNTTGKPISVGLACSSVTTGAGMTVTIGGVSFSHWIGLASNSGTFFVTVPAGSSYSLAGAPGGTIQWLELR